MTDLHAEAAKLAADLKLPKDFVGLPSYCRVAEVIEWCHATRRRPIMVGVAGCQGSGKSTLAAFLELLLNLRGLATATLSIDDFYLLRAERAELARGIHPLLATRGVPGTHDVERMAATAAQLQVAQPGEVTSIPRFDKALDDRASVESWRNYSGRAEVVLLEGWCVGAAAQATGELKQPLNALEADEDPDGIWRSYVNDQLAIPYRKLFHRLDMTVFLAAPSFECVFAWRKLQEDKLRAARGGSGGGLMSDAQLRRFIMNYERITRQMLKDMPARADVVLRLLPDQRIGNLELLNQTSAGSRA